MILSHKQIRVNFWLPIVILEIFFLCDIISKIEFINTF